MKKFLVIILVAILAVAIGIAIYFGTGGPGTNTLQFGNHYFLTQMRHNLFFDSYNNELDMSLDGARSSFGLFDERFQNFTFNFVSTTIEHSVHFIIVRYRLSGRTFIARMTAIINGKLVWFDLRTTSGHITIRATINQTVVNEGEIHNVRHDNVIVLEFNRGYYDGGDA